MKAYFYPEQVDITDIDVYGIKWNYDFSQEVAISQCKTGKSKGEKKPANPILWLRGLKDLIGASHAYLAMPQIPPKLKDFARTNGVIPLDYERLMDLETNLNVTNWQGSYALDNFERLSGYYEEIKKDFSSDIRHHYWFLMSDFWALPNNIRLKQCISYIQSLTKQLNENVPYHKWLLSESVILFSVALLGFCNELQPFRHEERTRYVGVKMIEGLGTIEDQEKVLKLIRSLAVAIAEDKTGQHVSVDVDEVRIPPPDYTAGLIELISRIMCKPAISIYVPRFIDYFLYETSIREKTIEKDKMCTLFHLSLFELDLLAKLTKNIVRFVDEKCEDHITFEPLLSF